LFALSARIIFDDVLLADRRLVELVADGHALEGAGEVRLVELEPRELSATLDLRERGRDELDAAALLANLDLVASLEQVRRDVDALAVDEDVLVLDELARLVARRSEAQALHDVVEAALDEAEHLLAGAALAAGRVEVVLAELLLEDAVDAARLLLLAEANRVLRQLDAALAVLAGRVRATGDRALVRVAALALEEELHALAAAKLANGTDITSHSSSFLRVLW